MCGHGYKCEILRVKTTTHISTYKPICKHVNSPLPVPYGLVDQPDAGGVGDAPPGPVGIRLILAVDASQPHPSQKVPSLAIPGGDVGRGGRKGLDLFADQAQDGGEEGVVVGRRQDLGREGHGGEGQGRWGGGWLLLMLAQQ